MTRFLLAVVVRLLPDDEWRRAMLAELAALDGARARWRFTLGCVRAVLTNPRVLRSLAALGGAYALVGAAIALVVGAPGGSGGWSLGFVYAVLFLEGAAVTRRRAAVVAPAAVIGAGLWCIALLASSSLRAHPDWALALIAMCALGAGLRGGATAALAAGFATCLAIFVVAIGIYSAQPQLAPDVAPASTRDPELKNRIESTETYDSELLLAGLLSFVLLVAKPRPGAEERLPG